MKNIKKEPIKKTNYETNLTYMMARYYSQGYGRFLSPDPGYDYDQLNPMSWNLYSYVRGNPVNYLDPFGLELTPEQKARLQHLQNIGAIGNWREFSDNLTDAVSKIDVSDVDSANYAVSILYQTGLNNFVDWGKVKQKNPALYQYLISWNFSKDLKEFVSGLERLNDYLDKLDTYMNIGGFVSSKFNPVSYFTGGMSIWINTFIYTLTGEGEYMKDAGISMVVMFAMNKFIETSDIERVTKGIYFSEELLKFMTTSEALKEWGLLISRNIAIGTILMNISNELKQTTHDK